MAGGAGAALQGGAEDRVAAFLIVDDDRARCLDLGRGEHSASMPLRRMALDPPHARSSCRVWPRFSTPRWLNMML